MKYQKLTHTQHGKYAKLCSSNVSAYFHWSTKERAIFGKQLLKKNHPRTMQSNLQQHNCFVGGGKDPYALSLHTI